MANALNIAPFRVMGIGQARREKRCLIGSYLLYKLSAMVTSRAHTPIRSMIANNPSSSFGLSGVILIAPWPTGEMLLRPPNTHD
jgi:hypothetical protein